MQCLLWLVGHFLNFQPLYAAESNAKRENPVIKSIQGSKTLTLLLAGKKREALVGDAIGYGEKVITTESTSAVIAYPDASQVTIMANSEFIIEDYIQDTQWNRLRKGTMRGIVTKISLPAASKPKFLVRTKSAVLGVRGTDFVVTTSLANETTQIHTLEGLVDVARNEVSLLSGQGAPLGEGQFLEASPTKGLSAPQLFNKQEFLDSLDSSSSSTSNKNSAPDQTKSESRLSEDTPSSSSHSIETSPVVLPTAPVIPPSTRFKEPESHRAPASNEPKKEQKATPPPSQSDGRFKILAFQTGMFFTSLPEQIYIRAVTAAWTPRIPVPFLTFLTLRGQVGGSFALEGSLNNNFLVKELQVFLTLTVFNFSFVEAGIGNQIWTGYRSYNSGLTSVNAGLIPKIGFIERIFIGYQKLDIHPPMEQYKLGIGLSF
jgi:hypothetical protein